MEVMPSLFKSVIDWHAKQLTVALINVRAFTQEQTTLIELRPVALLLA